MPVARDTERRARGRATAPGQTTHEKAPKHAKPKHAGPNAGRGPKAEHNPKAQGRGPNAERAPNAQGRGPVDAPPKDTPVRRGPPESKVKQPTVKAPKATGPAPDSQGKANGTANGAEGHGPKLE